MKTFTSLFLSSLLAVAAAQTSSDSTKPAPEMERLIKMWAGHWTTVEIFEPSDEMPQGKKDKGAETMHPGPGGLSLIGDYESHGIPFGHMVVTWIPKERAYKSYWLDLTQPGVSVSTGRWEGDKLVFTSVDESAATKLAIRDAYSDITPTSFTDTLETGPVGGPMKKVLTVKYTKQSDAAAKDLSIGYGKLFSVSKELIEHRTIEQLAAQDDGVNLLCGVNIFERISIEQK